MVTGKLYQPVLCISLSLWMTIVSEVTLASHLSEMEWLGNSISKADARKFCKNILKACEGRFDNFTSIESTTASCGIAECCRSPSSQRTFYDRMSAAKEHRIRNICFAKWAYNEMLEDNDELRHEAMQKLDRLMLLEKESSKMYKRTTLQLARDLKQITNGFVGSASPSGNLSYQILKRSSDEKSHHVTSRSTSNNACRTIMSTVLVTYGSNCAAKSLIIWYCQGTCSSRSMPQYDATISNTRSVEHCTCCSSQTLRYKNIVFVCTGGNRTRTVAWPFDCSCRPCSSVPNMEPASS